MNLHVPGKDQQWRLPVKLLTIMKLTSVLLFCATLQVHATAYSQKVSIRGTDIPLKHLFETIEQQTGYAFVYEGSLLEGKQPVNLDVSDARLQDVLDKCLRVQGLTFSITNQIIIIKKSAVAAPLDSADNAVSANLPPPGITVKGRIVNENGEPLSAANVRIKGTNKGTIAGSDGSFTLKDIQDDAVLEISYTGYRDLSIRADASKTMTIVLKQNVGQLNETVVIGYGSAKRKDLTGAVSSVNSDHMNLGGTTANVGQAIQGRAAGVQVQQSDFSPGAAMNIVVRGGNSINTSNQPLYVVDGFATDNGAFINPNDIEDIQILKDASATAIYGARGGNGVVLITTKKGKAGKVLIEGDISGGMQYLTYKPALLNGPQYQSIQNAIAIEDGNPPPFPPSFPTTNTDWWKVSTQQASIQNRSLSVSASDKGTKIFASVNYMKQIGVLKHTDMERYSGRIGAEKTLSDHVKMGANFYGASTNADLQKYSGDITAPLFSIMTAPPNIPIYNPDGSYYRYLGKDNALALLLEPTNNSVNRLINGNLFLDYEIIRNLTYHISGGAEFNQTTLGQYTPMTLVAGQAYNGLAYEQMSTSMRWLVEQYLTYKFMTGPHSLTVLAGTTSQKDNAEVLAAGSRDFTTDDFLYHNLNAGAIPTIPSAATPYSNESEVKLQSYFGRLNYNFKEKLLATFTLRDDASSRFGPKHRHGLFPSGAVAWRLMDENFIRNLNTFSNLKLRLSYGVTGNDRIGNYAYLSTFSNYGTVLSTGSTLSQGIEPSALANPNLKWESTAQFDGGLDMGFIGGKVNATIDVYRKKTSDLLVNVPVGQWWGFSSQLLNAGSIENKGAELSVSVEAVKLKDFSWNATFNFAYNIQKCLSLAPNVSIISTNTANPSGVVSAQEFTRLVPGKELGVIYGYKYAGVMKSGEKNPTEPNAKPGDPKYEDLNGDGVITPADRTYLGNTTPHYIAGFGNDFTYRGFDLNIFFQGAFGYYLYNMNRLVLESTTGADAAKRWVAGTNENTNIPREGYFLSTYGSYVNSRFVENASYVRLKQVSLSYNLPASVLRHLKIVDGIKLYATGQNLLTLTRYTGTDPEVNVHASQGNANVAGGLDFNAFPAFRTFVFGVRFGIH